MTIKRGYLFYAYSCLLFLPALYRLTLPQTIGNYLFYVTAFLVPVIVMVFGFLVGRIKIQLLGALLIVLLIIALSWLVSPSAELSLLLFFYGFKIYLLPIVIFLLGYHLSLSCGRSDCLKFLAVIVSMHFVFSLLFYYDLVYNPMYDVMSSRFTPNWVLTVGDFKAFTGLALSKFGLAYQVGFLIIGLLLVRKYDQNNRLAYGLTLLLGLIMIVFTYNKTIMVLLLFVMAYLVYRVSQNKSRALAYATAVVVLPVMLYGLTLFLLGQFSMTEVYRFLSPQTFWSRVLHWQVSLHYDISCIWSGYGAGYLYTNDLLMDSQYVSTYLELGILGSIAYFSLLAYVMYEHSPKTNAARIYIGLYFIIFAAGDMLGALTIAYVIGMMMAQARGLAPTIATTQFVQENGN